MANNLFNQLLLYLIVILTLVAAQSCGPGSETPNCPNSACCSRNNFCGYSPLHCGEGCQSQYGNCDEDDDPVSSSPPSPSRSRSSSIWSSTSTSSSWGSSRTLTSTDSWSTSSSSSLATFSTTATTTATVTITESERTTSTAKGTYQLQPTDKPSGAVSSQDKSVKSTVALAIVFFAGLMMA
ncbi:hypothetical protein BX616_010088 [Lobosporangium transversale]|uniref:Chitin-binding type-1 domain-containing protein n=1 Tax=Lobosporangium transversale TaxID=64571 RepID=A0A1Y2GKW1_9FUNG|nr:hypothetical protein BCR41DRAFT_422508 [Lobosporangium transversale]KAF9913392.1 hypothetical protein BX616_010088 [Lobosporangium transversale]ORZ14251.1 hypothetical protein BCR41DRAFT_422508 [Lobosporangium transversale]|eukprot:XP_021880729.1 hypothetical protein BCR41DRAFT_422508 [Lobosporangium transversale]